MKWCILNLLLFVGGYSFGQCISDYQKLIPDKFLAPRNNFGSAVAISGDYVAVGAPDNDSLAYNGGMVYLFKKSGDEWQRIATMSPSDLKENDRFGLRIDLSTNYLFVSSRFGSRFDSIYDSRVYVYEKGIEWTSAKESFIIQPSNPSWSFGGNIVIRDNEEGLLIADLNLREGTVYAYSKPTGGWESAMVTLLEPPEDEVLIDTRSQDFGIDIDYEDNLVVIGASDYVFGKGAAYLFRDESLGSWSNFTLLAQLEDVNGENSFGKNVEINNGNIYSSSQLVSASAIVKFNARVDWSDATQNERIFVIDENTRVLSFNFFVTDDRLLLGYKTPIDLLPNAVSIEENGDRNSGLIYSNPVSNISNYISSIDMDQIGNVIVGDTFDPEIPEVIGSASIVPYKSGWELNDLSKVVVRTENATDSNFGSSILEIDNYLFLGALRDASGLYNTGSVSIYELIDDNYKLIRKLLPDNPNVFDDLFGVSLAKMEDQLGVGYSGKEPNGQVVFYQKGINWSDLEIIETIEPVDTSKIKLFGSKIAIDQGVLVVGHQRHPASQAAQLSISIYERESNRWVFKQMFDLGNLSVFAKAGTPAVDVLNGDVLVAVGSGASIFKKENDHWFEAAKLAPIDNNFTNFFGTDVSLGRNNAFISAIGYDVGEIDRVGAVYVFNKPSSGWEGDIVESNTIIPNDLKKNGLFGVSIKSIENTLIVGAPLASFSFSDPQSVFQPGSAYIFQTVDHFWNDPVELVKIQGDLKTVKDNYGLNLHIGSDRFYVSAITDDNVNGFKSGAVYATNMPPVISTVPPICSGNVEIVELNSYPSGGTWIGPGVIDPSGSFDPSNLEPGNYELIYRSPNCTYESKLIIEIREESKVNLLSALETNACIGESVILSVSEEVGTSYRWFFSDNNKGSFEPVGIESAEIEANKKGYYFAMSNNQFCTSSSDTIKFNYYQRAELEIDPPDVVCSYDDFSLKADIEGGLWSGPGVGLKSNRFDPRESGNGIHSVQYIYQDEYQCMDTSTVEIRVGIVEPPAISTPGGICDESVALEIFNYSNTTRYELFRKTDQIDVFGSLGYIEKSSLIFKPGIYKVVASSDLCESSSSNISILDISSSTPELPPNVFTPNGDNYNDEFVIPVENSFNYSMTIHDRNGRSVFFSETENQPWTGGNSKPGVYYWNLSYEVSCDEKRRSFRGLIHLFR